MSEAAPPVEPELTEDEVARLRAAFAAVPFAELLGLEFVGAARGEAAFALTLRPELTRMEGIIHGGALASLLDTAAAFAVHTLLPPEGRTVTVDLTVHYLRPVSAGRVEARARVLREGHRLVILSVEAADEGGRLVATATTTYLKQQRPTTPGAS
ncbi:MAG TPA: PaaI family thioesterase [Pyrinomonadaceae bacterium]|nr:PaaI family thioesterase [Pyrinomonadaceae bacterium]